MADDIMLVVTVVATLLTFSGVGIAYLLRNEHRLTRLETKLDMVLHHLGLNPGPDKEKAEKAR